MVRWLVAAVAVAAAAVGAVAIAGQAASGAQPWDPELRDNFVFAESIPLALGLGFAVGTFGTPARRLALWVFAAGLLLAIPTGSFEYLGGILDARPPFPLYLVYLVHYIGGTFVLFSVAALLVALWVSGDRSFLVPKGQWRAYLRGAADELPQPLVRRLAGPLGVDLRQTPPAPGRYSFYEMVVSFPWWGFSIGLITITGLIKALRYVYPVPGPVLYWASTLHVAAMVLIGAKVLDQLRIVFARDRRVVLAVLGLVWALASVAVAYWFVTSAFLAKTPAKEGILSQLALLFGGIAVGVFALLLVRQCVSLITGRRPAG
jgi:hypothetical protein